MNALSQLKPKPLPKVIAERSHPQGPNGGRFLGDLIFTVMTVQQLLISTHPLWSPDRRVVQAIRDRERPSARTGVAAALAHARAACASRVLDGAGDRVSVRVL